MVSVGIHDVDAGGDTGEVERQFVAAAGGMQHEAAVGGIDLDIHLSGIANESRVEAVAVAGKGEAVVVAVSRDAMETRHADCFFKPGKSIEFSCAPALLFACGCHLFITHGTLADNLFYGVDIEIGIGFKPECD